MLTFIQDNAQNIIAVVIFLAILGFLYYKGKIPQAKRIVLALVVEAESIFGTGTGTMKYAYVEGYIYPHLPSMVRLFVSEQKLNDWIEEAVDTLKKDLQDDTTTTSDNTGETVPEASKEGTIATPEATNTNN